MLKQAWILIKKTYVEFLLRTSVTFFVWSITSLLIDLTRLGGVVSIEYRGLTFRADFVPLADPAYLIWLGLGTLGAALILRYFIVRAGEEKIRKRSVVMLFDDIVGTLHAFTAISFIYIYLKLVVHDPSKGSLLFLPLSLWLAAFIGGLFVQYLKEDCEA